MNLYLWTAVMYILDIIIVDVWITCRLFRYQAFRRIWIEISTHLICMPLYAFSCAKIHNMLGSNMSNLQSGWEMLFAVINIMVALLILITLIYEGHREYTILISTINRSSIYEAVNNVSCGLAFTLNDGTVIVSNRKMNWLVSEMINDSIWNYKDFWEYIIGFYGNDRVKRIDSAIEPTFKLKDKSVWEFKMRIIGQGEKSVIEITANDLTNLYLTMAEAEEENKKLEKIQKELAVTLRNIAEIRQQEELLAYKMRIHDKLGNAILTSSNLIRNDEISEEDKQKAIEIWKETVGNLKKNAYQGEKVGEDSLDDISNTAKLLGAKILLSGVFPMKNILFAPALREAMYNSIKHAKASEIYAEGEKVTDGYKVRIKDNGHCNIDKIKETGGLATMRRKLERAGGRMYVTINEGLELELFFPDYNKTLLQ